MSQTSFNPTALPPSGVTAPSGNPTSTGPAGVTAPSGNPTSTGPAGVTVPSGNPTSTGPAGVTVPSGNPTSTGPSSANLINPGQEPSAYLSKSDGTVVVISNNGNGGVIRINADGSAEVDPALTGDHKGATE